MKTQLSNRDVEAAKPREKPYKLADLDGLYLHISPTGRKVWRYNYKAAGKQQTKTYGPYPDLPPKDARRAHYSFRDGPQAAPAAPTFEAVMGEWLKVKLPSLSNAKHQLQVAGTLEHYVLPSIGQMPVDAIKRAHLVGVVRAVDARGATETAHRVAGRIRAVMDYAVDLGLIETHPGAGLVRVLSARRVKKHMASIPPDELGPLLRAIGGYPDLITRLGLLMLAHVFVRPTELRLMQWREIVDDDTWLIPADRMKLRKPHVVPLTPQTKGLLEQLRAINGDSRWVFRSVHAGLDKPISENTLLFGLYRLGYKGRMTAHGFRSLASTILNERSDFGADVIERQLAHKEGDAVRAAYNRADYLPQRRELMAWWSDLICKEQLFS